MSEALEQLVGEAVEPRRIKRPQPEPSNHFDARMNLTLDDVKAAFR